MSYDFTHMWNLKNKINKQTKQKQTHRYREHLMVARWERGLGRMDEKGEIKKYKLLVTKQSCGRKVEHKEYSQL